VNSGPINFELALLLYMKNKKHSKK
jgi:hypothetical protein